MVMTQAPKQPLVSGLNSGRPPSEGGGPASGWSGSGVCSGWPGSVGGGPPSVGGGPPSTWPASLGGGMSSGRSGLGSSGGSISGPPASEGGGGGGSVSLSFGLTLTIQPATSRLSDALLVTARNMLNQHSLAARAAHRYAGSFIEPQRVLASRGSAVPPGWCGAPNRNNVSRSVSRRAPEGSAMGPGV